ncbi:hypothetical protein [Rhodococcus qingshengii]|uniref:hypothetical protein n=1 Tax=Rhodococcus qingshengii TaxID=334542 RepID=UPI0035D9979F
MMREEFHLGGSIRLIIMDLGTGSNDEGSRFGFEFWDAGELVFSDDCFETYKTFTKCCDAANHLVDYLTGDVLTTFLEDPEHLEESWKYPPGVFVWLTRNLDILDYCFAQDPE